MAERDELGDIKDQGPWEREDEDESNKDASSEGAPDEEKEEA